MNRYSIVLAISIGVLLTPWVGHAITAVKQSQIQDLVSKVKNNRINTNDIYAAIKKLGLTPNDNRLGAVKDLIDVAEKRFKADGFVDSTTGKPIQKANILQMAVTNQPAPTKAPASTKVATMPGGPAKKTPKTTTPSTSISKAKEDYISSPFDDEPSFSAQVEPEENELMSKDEQEDLFANLEKSIKAQPQGTQPTTKPAVTTQQTSTPITSAHSAIEIDIINLFSAIKQDAIGLDAAKISIGALNQKIAGSTINIDPKLQQQRTDMMKVINELNNSNTTYEYTLKQYQKSLVTPLSAAQEKTLKDLTTNINNTIGRIDNTDTRKALANWSATKNVLSNLQALLTNGSAQSTQTSTQVSTSTKQSTSSENPEITAYYHDFLDGNVNDYNELANIVHNHSNKQLSNNEKDQISKLTLVRNIVGDLQNALLQYEANKNLGVRVLNTAEDEANKKIDKIKDSDIKSALRKWKPYLDALTDIALAKKDLAEELQQITTVSTLPSVPATPNNQVFAKLYFDFTTNDAQFKLNELDKELKKFSTFPLNEDQSKKFSELQNNIVKAMNTLQSAIKQYNTNPDVQVFENLIQKAEDLIAKASEPLRKALDTWTVYIDIQKEIGEIRTKAAHTKNMIDGIPPLPPVPATPTTKTSRTFKKETQPTEALQLTEQTSTKRTFTKQPVLQNIQDIQKAITTRLAAATPVLPAADKESMYEKLAAQRKAYLALPESQETQDIAKALSTAYSDLFQLQLLSSKDTHDVQEITSKEDAEKFVKDQGYTTLFDDLVKGELEEKNFTIISDKKNALKKLATRATTSTNLKSEDFDEMKEELSHVGVLNKYKSNFDAQNILTIENKLKEYSSEISKAKELEKAGTNASADIKKLNKKIEAAFEKITQDASDITDIKFKSSYQEIQKTIASIGNNEEKTKVSAEANTVFASFVDYVSYIAMNTLPDLRKGIIAFEKDQAQTNRELTANEKNIAAQYDAKNKLFKSLTQQYLDIDNDITKASKIQNKNDFIKLLKRVSEEERVAAVYTILIKLDRDLANAFMGLLKGQFLKIDNYNEYELLIIGALEEKDLLTQTQKNDITMAWRDRRTDYATHLLASLDKYAYVADLPNAHKAAFESSTDAMLKGTAQIIPEEPFNAIQAMIVDLSDYWKNNKTKLEEVTTKIWQNFAYMLATFDAFSYSLFNLSVTPKLQDQHTILSWILSWFGGDSLQQINNNSAGEYYQKLLNNVMTDLVNKMQTYENTFIIADSMPKTDSGNKKRENYEKASLNILTILTPQQQANSGLLVGNKYKYDLNVPSKIQFPGTSAEIIIPPFTVDSEHKKDWGYKRLVDYFKTIIADSYDQPFFSSVAQVYSSKMEEIAKASDSKLKQIRQKMADLESSIKTQESVAQLEILKKEYETTRQEGRNEMTSMQKKYDKLLNPTTEIISSTTSPTLPALPATPPTASTTTATTPTGSGTSTQSAPTTTTTTTSPTPVIPEM